MTADMNKAEKQKKFREKMAERYPLEEILGPNPSWQ
jgi:hypothetical protein